ncbi:Lrp/AsnC family transcriptional regulator [Candidatus Bathyarchaeota archaeon]|nr:Lrp/AsnC family transcriptional regulator [Candidatus Bathyarchaeota archaeon]
MLIDKLDEKILRHLSVGANSYEELAKLCNVTRSTVYRRITKLEKEKVVLRKLKFAIDITKLDIVPLAVGINISHSDEAEAIELLKKCPKISVLWRTYGAHNIALLALCKKGEEGQLVNDIREMLDELDVKTIDTCVGFTWEKTDMTLSF